MPKFTPGDLVRTREDGNYGDPLWAGALAIIMGPKTVDIDGGWVPLRRLSDGVHGRLRVHVVELPEEQAAATPQTGEQTEPETKRVLAREGGVISKQEEWCDAYD